MTSDNANGLSTRRTTPIICCLCTGTHPAIWCPQSNYTTRRPTVTGLHPAITAVLQAADDHLERAS